MFLHWAQKCTGFVKKSQLKAVLKEVTGEDLEKSTGFAVSDPESDVEYLRIIGSDYTLDVSLWSESVCIIILFVLGVCVVILVTDYFASCIIFK